MDRDPDSEQRVRVGDGGSSSSLWGEEERTDGASESPSQQRQRRRLAQTIEVLAVIVLSLATVSSAWSAYQATRWSGAQAVSADRAAALRTESARLAGLANAQTTVDVLVFTDWVAARSAGDQRQAAFLRARFRDEFRPAFEAWLASVPGGTIPPGTPFTRPEYKLAQAVEAERLLDEARQQTHDALDANQRSDNFVLTTVLFATVLFFAGIAGGVQAVKVRRVVLVLALLIWTGATVFMFSLPQSFGL